MKNALFNTVSGCITVESEVVFGHNVCLLTGTHDYTGSVNCRRTSVPREGNDIVIKRGAWIASNVSVLGACVIGENAVVAAGAVVTRNVAANTVVAGVPARVIRRLSDATS